MGAWQVRAEGEPAEVLAWDGEAAPPTPGPGEVRLRVEACGLNFADGLLCRGTYQERPPHPFTPGLEVVGIVDALGPGVDADLDERVLAATSLPHGGLADRCLARAADLLPLPEEVPAVVAAGLHVTYQTGWIGLHHRARVAPGDVVVVHAGAGGVGSAAIQLARAAGARVLATAGGPEKTARCLELGAEAAADSRAEGFDVRRFILDHTDGRGADVVVDPVGGPLSDESRRALAFEGRLLVVGFAGGEVPRIPANHVLVKNYDVIGVQWPAYRRHRPDLVRRAHESLLALLREGAIEPAVAIAHPMAATPDLLTDLLAGRTDGKLVVHPDAG